MSLSEFKLIEFFKQFSVPREDVLLGIGDDAAILQVPQGMQLVVTTDSLVAGTHFLAGTDPALIAYKALVSNISDLAAMGAEPAWCSLALTLPEANSAWLERFYRSFFALTKQYNIALIGGDTTKGSLAITITLQGFVQADKALLRVGASAGDRIFVTGTLGDSGAGLGLILQEKESAEINSKEKQLINRHFKKVPRVEVGKAIASFASSCLDISDGLCADLQHILNANKVGAVIEADKIPISKALQSYAKDAITAAQIALTSGEEYELCFTVSDDKLANLANLSLINPVSITCVGQITANQGLKVTWQKNAVNWFLQGWDHFIEMHSTSVGY